MEITSFNISEDRTVLNLVIDDAAAATSIKLFKTNTYKDYSKAIDLSSKLTGSTTEIITINLGDIGDFYFDGLYFIEVEDPNELVQALTGDFTRYKECIMNQLLGVSVCDDCLKNINNTILASQALLEALEMATELGFVAEAFNIINSLNKFCSDDCQTCGKVVTGSQVESFELSGELIIDGNDLDTIIDGGDAIP